LAESAFDHRRGRGSTLSSVADGAVEQALVQLLFPVDGNVALEDALVLLPERDRERSAIL
jgi:hypothetical protein